MGDRTIEIYLQNSQPTNPSTTPTIPHHPVRASCSPEKNRDCVQSSPCHNSNLNSSNLRRSRYFFHPTRARCSKASKMLALGYGIWDMGYGIAGIRMMRNVGEVTQLLRRIELFPVESRNDFHVIRCKTAVTSGGFPRHPPAGSTANDRIIVTRSTRLLL